MHWGEGKLVLRGIVMILIKARTDQYEILGYLLQEGKSHPEIH